MQTTRIQWTEMTWNPVRGCSRVSKGCEHCYAEETAGRFINGTFKGFVHKIGDEARWTGKVSLMPKKLNEPFGVRKPTKIFVNSMSDLFHPDFQNQNIGLVWVVMALCLPEFRKHLHRRKPGEHVFQILTKRPARMAAWVRDLWPSRSWRRTLLPWIETHIPDLQAVDEAFLDALPDVLPNVHIGTSIEDQATARERIPKLFQCPAALRFVSYEPALDAVDLGEWLFDREQAILDLMTGPAQIPRSYAESAVPPSLNLVIAGGESGRRARPARLEWFYRLADQARDAKVEFQLKQLGSTLSTLLKCDDMKAADPEEWPPDVQDRLANGPPLRNVFRRERRSV